MWREHSGVGSAGNSSEKLHERLRARIVRLLARGVTEFSAYLRTVATHALQEAVGDLVIYSIE